MSSQAIKEYDDFAGQDGYVIVNGLDAQTPGGKKLLSTIGGGGLTPITVNAVHTTNLCTVTIPSNNTFVTVPNINFEEFITIKIVPPTIGSNEVLNVVVELIPESGWDKNITVEGNLHKLGREEAFPTLIEGYLYAQVILRGNCYEILIEDDGE